jgi:hypothetical protein
MKVGCIVQRKHFYRNHSSLNVRNVSGTWNVLFIYSQFLFSYLCLLLFFLLMWIFELIYVYYDQSQLLK